MRQFCLLLPLILAFAIGCTPPPEKIQELPVGVLLDLTGQYAQSGFPCKAGIEVALEDANAYLASQNTKLKLKLVVEDGATDKEVALAKLQAFDAQGIKVVIGPLTSNSLNYVKDYANSHGIILVSPSSTAPSLAIDDNVLRTAPVDIVQAKAIAKLMADQDVKSLVTLYRDEIWGQELNTLIGQAAHIYSIHHAASQSYPVNTTDFAPVVSGLSAQVRTMINQVGTASVAVQLSSFDEIKDIFLAAKDDPALKAVRWYGCDTNAVSSALLGDSQAASFATQTRFRASMFLNPYDAGNSVTRSAYLGDLASLKGRIQAKLGSSSTEYSLTTYDTLWLIAHAAKQLGALSDAAQIKEAITLATKSYVGQSGQIHLSMEGDRTNGDYGFYGITDNAWKRKAIYRAPQQGFPLASLSIPVIQYLED